MDIKTKYEIGQHIWVVYTGNKEVCVYDDYIVNILIDENKEIVYCIKETYEELKEKEIILYEELDKLGEEVKKLMQEIRNKEEQ